MHQRTQPGRWRFFGVGGEADTRFAVWSLRRGRRRNMQQARFLIARRSRYVGHRTRTTQHASKTGGRERGRDLGGPTYPVIFAMGGLSQNPARAQGAFAHLAAQVSRALPLQNCTSQIHPPTNPHAPVRACPNATLRRSAAGTARSPEAGAARKSLPWRSSQAGHS